MGPFGSLAELLIEVEKCVQLQAGKVLCLQSSLVKVHADRPTPKTLRSYYVVIRESKSE